MVVRVYVLVISNQALRNCGPVTSGELKIDVLPAGAVVPRIEGKV
jgi:hypothetical protein